MPVVGEEIEKLKMAVSKLTARVEELEGEVHELKAKKRKPRSKKDSTGGTGKTATAEVRAAFLEAYEKQFGHSYPCWGARENGLCSNWLKSIPLEKALDLVLVYMNFKDPFVVKSGHPFYLLVQKTVEIEAATKRYPQIWETIAKFKAQLNTYTKQIQDSEEVAIHARIEAGHSSSPSLGHEGQKQISGRAQERISGGDHKLTG